jgi:lipopolysaccharide biosynthesis glycosyltransferase
MIILLNRFRNDIHIVHFAGALKPWQLTFNPQNEQLSGNLGGQSDIQREFLLSWWRVMHQHVWPNINQISQVKYFTLISIHHLFLLFLF